MHTPVQMAVMSPQHLRRFRAAASLVITPTMRTAMRAALEQEAALAASMPDDVFWGYDRAWLALGTPTLEDARRPGACGGGGCNITFNNNQHWALSMACDRSAFSLVMFQQRRYMAAQIRLQRLLDLAPDRRILDGFDRYAAGDTNVRASCAGAAVRDKPTQWAAWCVDVLRTIGVARWASNVTWSEGSVVIPNLPSSALGLGRPTTYTGDRSGCTYAPDCVTDAFGVPRYGYVAGNAPGGVLRYENVVGQRRFGWLSVETATTYRERRDEAVLGAVAGWRPDPRPRLVGESLWSIAPKALGLHKSSRSYDWVPSAVPQGMYDFDPVILPEVVFPSILRAPTGRRAFDWFSALFAELDAPASQMALREQTGAWWFLRQNYAFPTPAGELVVWHVLALLRDVMALSFGQLMVQAFENLDRTIELLPAWAKTQSLTDAQTAMRNVLRSQQQEAGAVVGAVFSGVGSIAGAFAPVVGIIIAIIGQLVAALISFAIELGLMREGNPPALQFLVARQIPTIPGGEDRCAVNPGEETAALYRARVAAPYIEAARRTGGNPSTMFDEIARVRAEQAGLIPPEAPASGSSLPFAVIGGAAGTALVRLLIGV